MGQRGFTQRLSTEALPLLLIAKVRWFCQPFRLVLTGEAAVQRGSLLVLILVLMSFARMLIREKASKAVHICYG